MRVMKWFILTSLMVGFFQLSLFPKISSRVQGQVIDKDTKQPIQGAKVQLIYLAIRSNYLRLMQPDQETFTDKDGKFKFEVGAFIKGSAFYLQCEKKGYISLIPSVYLEYRKDEKFLEMANVFTLQEGQIKHFAIELEKGGGLKGTVYKKEASGISPYGYVSGYLQRITNPDVQMLRAEKYEYDIAHIEADEKGKFEIAGIEPYEDYLITLLLNGYPTKIIPHIKIEKNVIENIEYVIDLTNPTGISGIIKVGQDMPEAGYVRMRNISKTPLDYTDICLYRIFPDGKYWCKGLNPGTYRMNIEVYKAGLYKKEFTVEIEADITKVFDINF